MIKMMYFNYLLILTYLIFNVNATLQHNHLSQGNDNRQEIDFVKLNLSFKDKYYFYLFDAGLFSELNNLIYGYIYCLLEEKQLVLVDKEWNFHNWEVFFEPFFTIDNTHIKNDLDSIYRYSSPLWNKIRNPQNLIKESPYFNTTDPYVRVKIISELIFKPKYIVNNEIDIKSPYISVHVRGGDKVGTEMDNISPLKYINAILHYANKYNINNIFYASDDLNKLNCIISELPQYNHYRLNNKYCHHQNSFNQLSIENKQSEFSLFMNEIMLLKNSFYFIGTYSSNVGRFVTVLKSLNTSSSLDIKQWEPV
jgi:hypothetical protein